MRLQTNRAAAAVGVALLLTLPFWLRSDFYLHLINLAAVYAIAVVGLNFITGEMGQIALGHAGFLGVGAYTAAILGTAAHWNFWAGTLAAAAITTVVAVAIGLPTVRLKGHYLAIATLGLGEIIRLVLNTWRSLTKGYQGIGQIPSPELFGFPFQSRMSFYYLAMGLAVLLIFLAVRIKRSTFGRSMMAVRDNDVAAMTMGISPPATKLLAFALSGFYAGVAGSLYAHLFTFISPDTFGVDLSIIFLSMLILGGAGNIAGATVGAVALTLLPEWLRFMGQYYMLFYGAIIIATIVFMPRGIVGTLQARLAHRRPVRSEQGVARSG